ncbi:hypothetical protein NIES4072_50160 [Nostoc commune NIES-4072]|uniref:Uncharacterized protein n=1 Tax=Nostoc commune NIES-4072 TaxID=2005467 RepID=A0A2R5FRF2_NOSCO|nr:hypothetical protein NIES4070_40790 [Nostoc commune HK-02]GBG21332.1 hypothetical protein NIES4072_50160 [Nostoc commune NIES-4072]
MYVGMIATNNLGYAKVELQETINKYNHDFLVIFFI